MKVIKWIISATVILIVSYYIFSWWNNRNYLESGETFHFKVKVGETFNVKLYENASTGYRNCWINSLESESIILVGTNYTNNLQSKLGYVGSGGRISFTFKAIKRGSESILIASCPTLREDKSCSEYTTQNTEADNIITVNVD